MIRFKTKQTLAIEATHWAQPDWAWNGIPLESADQEIVNLDNSLAILYGLLDLIDDDDSTAVGYAAHVAHFCVVNQIPGSGWSASFNARTGEVLGEEVTYSPLELMRLLTGIIKTSEFDYVFRRVANQQAKTGGEPGERTIVRS